MLRITVRNLWADRLTTLLGSISVTACIAFVTAVLIVSATVSNSFNGLFSTSYAASNAVVRSSNKVEGEFGRDNRDQIPDTLLGPVRQTPGVVEAIGAIEGKALISTLDGVSAQQHEDLPELGGIYVDSPLTPWHLVAGGRSPHGVNEVVIDVDAAKTARIIVGDTIRVTTRVGAMKFSVVGLVTFADGKSAGGATWALFDTLTAESVVIGSPGLVDELRVRGDGSTSDAELVSRLRTTLATDPDAEVLTGRQVAVESEGALGRTVHLFTSLALLFAGIATIAGGFIIAAALATTAARRQVQHGLLRAVGATRRQIVASTLAEAALLGIVGATVGFVLGIGLASLVGRFLSALGVALPPSDLVVRPVVAVIDIALALGVVGGAGSLPALAASRVPPLVATHDQSGERSPRTPTRLGVVAAASAGAIVAVSRATNTGSSVLMLIGLVLAAAAVMIAGPVVVGSLGSAMSRRSTRPHTVARWIAARTIAGRPRRFALGTNAAMVAVALVVSTSVVARSADVSLYDNVAGQIGGDLLISSTKPSQQFDGIFPTSLVSDIAKLPPIEHVTGVGYQRFSVIGKDGQPTDQVARVIDPSSVAGLVDLEFRAGSLAALGPNGVLLSAGKAKRDGLKFGDHLAVTLLNGEVHDLVVAGIFARDDLTNEILDIHLFDTQSKTPTYGLLIATTKPGVSEGAGLAAIKTVVADYATARVQTRRAFLASQSEQFGRYLHIIDALLALSVFVAVAGVGTMLMLSVQERSREFAMLRISGLTARQLRSMISWESALTCLLGSMEGAGLGLLGGWVFVRVLRDRGIHHFAVAPVNIGIVIVAGVLTGVAVSVWPARRAAAVDSLSELTPT